MELWYRKALIGQRSYREVVRKSTWQRKTLCTEPHRWWGRRTLIECVVMSETYWPGSDCTLNILTGRYGIPTTFETFWSPSRENRNGKPLQILLECPECASNEPECSSKASRMLPESISILKEFSWNAIRMPSESFDCRSNAARMQSERADWPSNESGRNSEHHRIAYPGIYK